MQTVREHAKVMDGATKYPYKELLRTMKFVTGTARKALVLAPEKVVDNMWKIRGTCVLKNPILYIIKANLVVINDYKHD